MKKLLNICLSFILLFSFFIPFVNINAETVKYAKLGDLVTSLRMRKKPSTDGEYILSIPTSSSGNTYRYLGEAEAGNGCIGKWYNIEYGSSNGYVCSDTGEGSYIDIVDYYIDPTKFSITYDRPWISPKKAIVGGAKFISAGYINTGQFTSYLKKFNVNPNSSYPVYNHQYMANLGAPSSEAYSSFKSLRDNGLLNSPYNFVIPVFGNMPDTTYNASIKDTDLRTADVQDEAFENNIKSFPNSYKPYLRYLHTIHNNWTFTALNTGRDEPLDFTNSYQNEKWASSIWISSGLCEQNPYVVTENGWCIANDDATKFFLDPRNFLTETYVFMFENLGYSDLYNESVVQNVLNNTFMTGLSIIDNQLYSSIFVEAGKIANVSPLYLASLARQESGTSLKITTSGAAFEYNGYSYSGLYNFFNIGAYSGEANPAKAGLVFANGGAGGNSYNPGNNPDNPSQPNINFISLLKVNQLGNYVKGYNLHTKISDIKSKVGNQAEVTVRNANNDIKPDNSDIGTGDKISISSGNQSAEYTYIMHGDLNGDGQINSADLLKMRQHLLNIDNLSGAYYESAELTGDGEIKSDDLLRIRKHLLEIQLIEQ